jgi:chromosome segregation ATPase
MAKPSALASPPDSSSAALPVVRVEARLGGRATVYEVGDGGFLVGGVPGCDLRLPGANVAPVVCLISRHPDGAGLRKLAPVYPVLVNGKSVSSTYLAHGDRVTLGPVELMLSIALPAAAPRAPAAVATGERLREVEARERQLAAEQAAWTERLQELEEEHRRQGEQAGALNRKQTELDAREQTMRQAQEMIVQLRQRLEAHAGREGEDVGELRAQLVEMRKQLYQRYQKRRELLAKKETALHRVARRQQERKRALDTDGARVARLQQDLNLATAEVEAAREQLGRERTAYEEQANAFAGRQQEVQRVLNERVRDLEERERKLAEEKTALEKGQKQHQADLVRLDRIQATLEQRQKQLQQRALEVDHRSEELQRDSRDLEEQAAQLDEWHNRLSAETEQLAQQQKEQQADRSQLDQRAAALEGQQAMLATLRTRLERMREDLRGQEQALADQRVMQEATETDLRDRLDGARKLREELDNDKQLFDEERKRFDEKSATLDAAVARLNQAQDKVAAQESQQNERQLQLDAISAEQTEQAGLLLARGNQLEELHNRLNADRQLLKEREAGLAKAEQALAALQEQLRRRSDELNERQQGLDEREQKLNETSAQLDARVTARDTEHKEHADRLEALRVELAERAAELDALSRQLVEREGELCLEKESIDEANRSLSGQRQVLASERIAWEVERQAATEQAARIRSEFEVSRSEAVELGRHLPDLEGRATAALDRLVRAREQLREHLSEVHTYARQSRDDLEEARKLVQAELERVRQQELDLHVARDEHRLAVAAFRQQLIEWQGQVGEMRMVLRHGETRLDRRQAEVEEKARELADSADRLAREAEQLQAQQKLVAERREEVDRHLSDMREWYRKKMRELSGIDREPDGDDAGAVVVSLPAPQGEQVPDVSAATPGERDILTLTGDGEPGDRQLGELLLSLELIDRDTLTAVLLEARRQRKSLRQLLLAGNFLTLYQMALIEAGNLDGLVLGPVRVIDRLRATPREAVYRVFDPRCNGEALLRHLAEAELADAVRPDEFRQRFAAASAVRHPHLVTTLEVLDIGGRPAALQEWLTGLPGTDWPSLASAPGVWFRLLSQAALALQAAHSAGLVHGHLSASALLMTAEGSLKLTGLGEPRWLTVPPLPDGPEPAAADDLAALGAIAADWAGLTTTGKKARSKALPEALLAVPGRLRDGGYATAADLLGDLDRVGAEVPANAAAWERFVRQVREGVDAAEMRRTA